MQCRVIKDFCCCWVRLGIWAVIGYNWDVNAVSAVRHTMIRFANRVLEQN